MHANQTVAVFDIQQYDKKLSCMRNEAQYLKLTTLSYCFFCVWVLPHPLWSIAPHLPICSIIILLLLERRI